MADPVSTPLEFVFLPLGGVGEIGMNMGLYGYGPRTQRQWIMVDCGIGFGNTDETPGVDVIMADTRFIEKERHHLKAILITHAHEDHYGALINLWPRLQAPVYMTPFAASMLAGKLAAEPGAPDIDIHVVQQGERLELDPFEVEIIPVSHSIAEPCALRVKTPAGVAMHTGDWKLDPTPGVGEPINLETFKAIGAAGVDVVIADSTNANKEGESPSEADIGASLKEIIASAPHRVAVTTFSSQIARIRSVAEAAVACGREVVLVGRALRRAVAAATDLGYFDGLPPFRDQEAFGYLPRSNVVLLLTGSQGEERAALAKVARDEHRDIAFSKGDMVIFSSRTIPGNERSVNNIINALSDQGIDVMTDRDALIHVSGHPRRGEIRKLYDCLKPKALVPVHGEPMHLKAHEELAHALGLATTATARNGSLIRLAPGPVEIMDQLSAGRLHRDGLLLLDETDEGVAERRKLGFAGAIFVALLLGPQGDLLDDCEVELVGLPQCDAGGTDFADVIGEAVDEALHGIPRSRRRNEETVREAARRAARGAANRAWGKKPICRVLVMMAE